jgi:hypothetical protein
LQFEPVAGTISGSPLQKPETPAAILTGAADRGECRQAAGAVAQDLMLSRAHNGWLATENTTMQQVQLGIFVAAMIAIVVCGCIFTRKPKKPH